jgi:putative transcriptional regulator
MKLKSNLHKLMGDRKIRNISELSDATGITRKTLTRLYDDKGTAIEFETVIKLCAFFECNVGDLLYVEK